MASGEDRSELLITEAANEAFEGIKRRRKFRYVIFEADEDSFELRVDQTGGPDATAEDFSKALPASAPRYALFDHEMKMRDSRVKETLYFVSWSPPTALGRAKMLYSSQKLHVRGKMDGTTELTAGNARALLATIGVKEEGAAVAAAKGISPADEEGSDDSDFD